MKLVIGKFRALGEGVRFIMNGANHPLTGTFAPDLAGRPDLRQVARDWRHRVDVHTAAPAARDGRGTPRSPG
ncbi:hypothetical protein [Nonomuraea sp. SBT364]|uniref:hypothetical protein n=1 Tax=Nonomuraea sp. SBT364 TaxID=1580530 RepID=UPI001E436F70|nr:hypothetical protein [Nonomuraea sp. SBT364]